MIALQHSPYKVEDRLLSPMFYRRGCSSESPCHGECCLWGQDVPVDTLSSLQKDWKQFQFYLRKESREAGLEFILDKAPYRDQNYLIDFLLYDTMVLPDSRVGQSCFFLNPEGNCSLQVYSREIYHSEFKFKPLSCSIWPLVVVKGVVRLACSKYFDTSIDHLVFKKCLKRSHDATLGTVLFKEELRRILGSKGYKELLRVSQKPAQ